MFSCFKCINISPETNQINNDASNSICNQDDIDINILNSLKEYDILEKLGTGATSTVYKVKNNSSSNLFVCKVIKTKFNSRGKREINVLRKISNETNKEFFPCLVDTITVSDKHYILMKYEKSVELFDFVIGNHNRVIQDFKLLMIIKQMINAVYHLHLSGFVHLDIKLENFLITNEGLIKLIDFGTCHEKALLNKRLSIVVGTRNYAPHELYRNFYHSNTDVWSLGVCIWVLLTRESPFNHENINREFFSTHDMCNFTFPTDNHFEIKPIIGRKFFTFFKSVFKMIPVTRLTINELMAFDFEDCLTEYNNDIFNT